MGDTKNPVRGGSLRVATLAGIPVRIHFTFLLFMIYVWVVAEESGHSQLIALVPAIFVCVVLHELGHALTARRYGIETRDITLFLFGGVATIDGRPKPAQELWIALAGPAVNVLIALILLPFVYAQHGGLPRFTMALGGAPFIEGLFMANLFLPVFNLIPALPMDGGRVLRALLALNMEESRATRIAASVGQALAFGMAVVGLFLGSIFLLLIAFFVFTGAAQEVAASVSYSLVSGRKVSDAMVTNFRVIGSGELLGRAQEMLLEGAQTDFPVVWGEEVLGLLRREDIYRGLATTGAGDYIAGYMTRDFKRAAPEEPLEKVLETFARGDFAPVLVLDGESLKGMVTVENLGEFMTLQQVQSRPQT
jgi:Zn-dependent protease/CBS domain-containing protein